MARIRGEPEPEHDPVPLREQVLMLGREPAREELDWLDGFRQTGRSNYILISSMTDTRTGQSVPFHLVVFKARRGPDKPTIPGKWMWGIHVNPTRLTRTEDAPSELLCQGDIFNGVAEAALDARKTLLDGGFDLSRDVPIVASIRARLGQLFGPDKVKEDP